MSTPGIRRPPTTRDRDRAVGPGEAGGERPPHPDELEHDHEEQERDDRALDDAAGSCGERSRGRGGSRTPVRGSLPRKSSGVTRRAGNGWSVQPFGGFLKLLATSTKVRTPKPVAPFTSSPSSALARAGPAMSRWTHGHVADELLEEEPGGERAAVAAADVLDVGDLGLDLLAVLLRQRQRPHAARPRGRRPRATWSPSASSLLMSPAILSPSATMHAPVSVARSTMASGLSSRRARARRRG